MKSGLLLPAMAPEILINPPIKAPEPAEKYKNKRSVRHGAIDSLRSLVFMFPSRPPFFLLSLKRINGEDEGGDFVFTFPCTVNGADNLEGAKALAEALRR